MSKSRKSGLLSATLLALSLLGAVLALVQIDRSERTTAEGHISMQAE